MVNYLGLALVCGGIHYIVKIGLMAPSFFPNSGLEETISQYSINNNIYDISRKIDTEAQFRPYGYLLIDSSTETPELGGEIVGTIFGWEFGNFNYMYQMESYANGIREVKAFVRFIHHVEEDSKRRGITRVHLDSYPGLVRTAVRRGFKSLVPGLDYIVTKLKIPTWITHPTLHMFKHLNT